MHYGIAGLSIIPCRSKPKESAEQSTQLLFGEPYEVLDQDRGWVLIRILHDRYEAWIDEAQATPLPEEAHKAIVSERPPRLAIPMTWIPSSDQQYSFPILYGSPLHSERVLDKCRKNAFHWPTTGPGTEVAMPSMAPSVERFLAFAKKFLNAPYLWGGRSLFGIDCSGFVQMTFLLCGLNLARDAKDQVKEGMTINLIEEARAGDLAFFRNTEGKVHHVGILLTPERIIHASASVRIDPIDHHGIYNVDKKQYTHTLHLIKRHNKFQPIENPGTE